MPRDSSGTYTLPPGNPVVGGTLIATTWANPTMADIANALTNSLDRNGNGGMLTSFKFSDGTLTNPPGPGMQWTLEPTSGFYRAGANDMQAVIAGVPRMRWTADSVDVWDTGLSAWLSIVGPSGGNFAFVNGNNTFTANNLFNAPGTLGGSAVATWTGQHTFSAATTFDAAVDFNAAPTFDAGAAFNTGTFTFTAPAVVGGSANALWTGATVFNAPGTLGGSAPATWTGKHTFADTGGRTSFQVGSGNFRTLDLTDSGGARRVFLGIGGAGPSSVWGLAFGAAGSETEKSGITLTRSASGVASVDFGNTTDNPAFNFLGAGMAKFGGLVRAQGSGRFVGWNAQINGDIAGAGVEVGALSGAGYVQAYSFTGGAYIPLNIDGNNLIFQTQGTPRLTIDAAGSSSFSGPVFGPALSIAIGAAADPIGSVAVTRDAAANYVYYGMVRSGQFRWGIGISVANDFIVGVPNAAGFDSTMASPAMTVTGAGTVTAAAFNVASSRSLKQDIRPPDPSQVREVLSKLQVRLWRAIANPEHERISAIAEDVHEVCPWLSQDGKTLTEGALSWLLLSQWQAENGVQHG